MRRLPNLKQHLHLIIPDRRDPLRPNDRTEICTRVDGRYDGRSKLETWLYRIVTNTCIDQLRKRKSRKDEPEEQEGRFDGLVTAEARVALRELDEMLAELSAQDRAAIVLVHVEGLTVKEAAETLGTTEGAMEQRLLRARAALRKKEKQEEVNNG